MSITDDLRMAVAKVWDEWSELHGIAAPAHIVDAWLSVTIAADALDSEVAALTAQRYAATRELCEALGEPYSTPAEHRYEPPMVVTWERAIEQVRARTTVWNDLLRRAGTHDAEWLNAYRSTLGASPVAADPDDDPDIDDAMRRAVGLPVAADPPEQEPKRHAGAFFDHIEKYGSPAVKAAARRAEQELAADPPTEEQR